MKLIILGTLFVFVFGDHHEGHQSKTIYSTPTEVSSKQALEYGVPFNAELILNPFTKDIKNEHNKNKVTFISSSSHSHTFKNKTTHSTTQHQGPKPDGTIFQDLPQPHNNVVSFIFHHSSSSHFSNRTKPENTKTKVKSFILESSKEHSIDASKFDDGSYKPELYKVFDHPTHNSVHVSSKIKSNDGWDKHEHNSRPHLSVTSNFDDGSYKPELYSSQKSTSHDSYGLISDAIVVNDGSYRNEIYDNHNSRAHTSLTSNFDNGSYKPELYKSVVGHAGSNSVSDDGSYKHEVLDQRKTSDKSNFDDGSYKSELYERFDKSNDGTYRHGVYPATKEEHSNDAANYDDGSYKPELYNSLKSSSHDLVANEGLYNHEHNSRAHTSYTSNFNDGSYKPELYKSVDQTSHGSVEHASSKLVSDDGSYKHELLDQRKTSDKSNFDDGSYKSELYKSFDKSNDGTYKHGVYSASKVKDSNDATNYDDGSYKPELYKSVDQTSNGFVGHAGSKLVSEDGSYKHEVLDQRKTSDKFIFDDGSYKSELYKSFDKSNDGTYKHGVYSTSKVELSNDNYDDGSYKPGLYKTSDKSQDGFYKHEAEQNIFQTNGAHSNDASNYDDGSYKPQLYKTFAASSVYNDESYKQETLNDQHLTQSLHHSSSLHNDKSKSTLVAHIDDGLQNGNQMFKPHTEYGVPDEFKVGFKVTN